MSFGSIQMSLYVANLMQSHCLQAILKKAGKASVLGSLEENDPDADDGDDAEEEDADEGSTGNSNTIVDKLTDLLGKTRLTSK